MRILVLTAAMILTAAAAPAQSPLPTRVDSLGIRLPDLSQINTQLAADRAARERQRARSDSAAANTAPRTAVTRAITEDSTQATTRTVARDSAATPLPARAETNATSSRDASTVAVPSSSAPSSQFVLAAASGGAVLGALIFMIGVLVGRSGSAQSTPAPQSVRATETRKETPASGQPLLGKWFGARAPSGSRMSALIPKRTRSRVPASAQRTQG